MAPRRKFDDRISFPENDLEFRARAQGGDGTDGAALHVIKSLQRSRSVIEQINHARARKRQAHVIRRLRNLRRRVSTIHPRLLRIGVAGLVGIVSSAVHDHPYDQCNNENSKNTSANEQIQPGLTRRRRGLLAKMRRAKPRSHQPAGGDDLGQFIQAAPHGRRRMMMTHGRGGRRRLKECFWRWGSFGRNSCRRRRGRPGGLL